MTVKDYLAPDAEFIEFDNSDVIVASPHDMPCHSSLDAQMYCKDLGDSSLPNDCEWYENGYYCTVTSLGILRPHCDSSGNQIYTNSAPGRHGNGWDE